LSSRVLRLSHYAEYRHTECRDAILTLFKTVISYDH